MDFPIYRKLVLAAGFRGPFPTDQYFMFLSARETLNVRLDNVTSIGYAKDMPEEVAASMIDTWTHATAEEFNQVYAEAKRKIGLIAEMKIVTN